MAAALGRLLPNVGGPSSKIRRLYANVVQSVSLYGAPIWAKKVAASRRIKAMIHRQQRRLARRIIRSYCTASFAATTAMAGVVPVEFLANSYAEVLTGHGCFGDHLCRIGKEHTTECHHCAASRDSAQQTLAECEAWARERRALTTVVGKDLSLTALFRAMLEGEEKWQAVFSFCTQVMQQKEEAATGLTPNLLRGGEGE
ncbi:uncharacterized protein [Linepithema humile]|uniref:uncharacterized protein n=1 Tax=Linepithema humile TaxID=83485 RepID=UPI00351DFE82